MSSDSHHPGRPVVFGEILFDHFPDGSAVIGGAPLNVALHLQAFGHRPLMISRVGTDAEGDRACRAVADRGLDTSAIQRDDEHPTGAVQVALDADGSPTFDILPDRAYDFIDADAATQAVADAGGGRLLYHGTLAGRSPRSREALLALHAERSRPRFVDVNLRPPWDDRETVRQLCRGAQWLKVNREELGTLLDRDAAPDDVGLEAAARDLMAQLEVPDLLVTLGGDGAALVSRDGSTVRTPTPDVPNEQVVDTVGAGDALAAVAILGELEGWSMATTLSRGVEFAAAICTVRGAVPDPDQEFYGRFRRDWELST